MNKTIYYLIKCGTWIIHILPMRINYLFSDFLFLIAYFIVGYRRGVVRKNLQNSFPEKSLKEILSIEKKFYHHLCDFFIETLYFDHISTSEIQKRVKFLNPQLANDYMEKGRPVVVLLGHYNNWEWPASWPLVSKYRFYPIYKKLTNRTFDHFYFTMRSRFGAIPLDRSETFRQLMTDQREGIPFFSSFIFDQTPRINDIQYWTTFLNQDTPVVMGAEKIALKLNAVVLFAHMKKVKRGYYEMEYSLITDNAKETAKFQITESGSRHLEKIILEKPEYWLWSHKRWKHKRVKSEEC